jgi:hypothetical protein
MSTKQRAVGYGVLVGELVFVGMCMFFVVRYMP